MVRKKQIEKSTMIIPIITAIKLIKPFLLGERTIESTPIFIRKIPSANKIIKAEKESFSILCLR